VRATIRKLLSAALAAVLLAASLPASASDALGHDLAARDTTLHAGVELADGTFWSDTYSDLRRENYVVYTPNERVKPIVTSGRSARALTTATAEARALEAQGLRVAAGVNGDYYSVQYGIPLGSTMTDGALRNANGDEYCAVGFRADGTAVIGDPKLSIRAAANGSVFSVFAFNHLRHSDYGVNLYDSSFNERHTTGTSEPGVDVICSVLGGALTIGGTLDLLVEKVLDEATDTVVEEGKYVLTANLLAPEGYTAPLLEMRPGDTISVSVVSGAENSDEWNEVVNMIGAPMLLVENGAVVGGLAAGSAPRTAVGQRADGSLVFYTIDGRSPGYSIGASLTAVAMRLVELGCVTAAALDGGGSTTLVATLPNETSARVVNTPSDGGERPVGNHIFLVAPNEPSGVPDHIYLSPSALRALPGAQITLTAAAVDSNYIPMDEPVTLRSDAGSLSGSVLTLPDRTGTVLVTASCHGRSEDAEIEVVEPERIILRRGGTAIGSLTIAPNSDVTLTAEGVANHLTLAGDSDCFTWHYTGSGAALLPDGHTLRAGSDAGTGTLTVSLGGKSLSIPVTVAAVPFRLLNDFEAPFEPVAVPGTDEPGAAPYLTLSRAADESHVRRGRASARLDYALPGAAPATLPLSYAVSSDYNRLELWVCGDGSGVTLSFETDAGSTSAVSPEAGWNALSLPLPSGARRITGLTLNSDTAASGAVWLDQLVLTDGKRDDAPPEVSLTLDALTNTLTGRAFDAVNGATLPTFRLACDGAALACSLDSRTGALSAALPANDGFAHRVTLTAGDAMGNLARVSLDLPAAPNAGPAFPDTAGHWANDWIAYLRRTGVSNGSGGLYHPDANITRQEFAVMLFRYLAPAEDFSSVELPFSDSDQIADWALDAARAMYALGIIGGTPDGRDGLLFNPTANVSRQEAVTMLGRLLGKGWSAPELSFTDRGAIPDWAAEHVRVLSALGVLGGFEDGSFLPANPLTRAQMAKVLFLLN